MVSKQFQVFRRRSNANIEFARVSYDDVETLTIKRAFANHRCLGGLTIWALNLDEPEGTLLRGLTGTQQKWKNPKWRFNSFTVDNNYKILVQNQIALVSNNYHHEPHT